MTAGETARPKPWRAGSTRGRVPGHGGWPAAHACAVRARRPCRWPGWRPDGRPGGPRPHQGRRSETGEPGDGRKCLRCGGAARQARGGEERGEVKSGQPITFDARARPGSYPHIPTVLPTVNGSLRARRDGFSRRSAGRPSRPGRRSCTPSRTPGGRFGAPPTPFPAKFVRHSPPKGCYAVAPPPCRPGAGGRPSSRAGALDVHAAALRLFRGPEGGAQLRRRPTRRRHARRRALPALTHRAQPRPHPTLLPQPCARNREQATPAPHTRALRAGRCARTPASTPLPAGAAGTRRGGQPRCPRRPFDVWPS